jgi:putative DNA primase/helicase
MINVKNGALVVRRSDDRDYVALRPHAPSDLMTKIAPVTFDPAATCPVYDQFLAEVQPDARMRRFLHQWAGLSLTGDISPQRMVIFWGRGSNGKSTLVETWAAVAGGYGTSIPIESFLDQGRARRGGEPTPDPAGLSGVRFLRTSEPERSRVKIAIVG